MKEKMKGKKKLIPVVLLLLIVCTVVAVNWIGSNRIAGEMEAVVVPCVSEISGKLMELRVELGQTVKEGDVLAVLDSSNQEFAVKQLELGLEQAMLDLGQAQGGSGSASGNALLAAQASHNSAAAAAGEAARDYQKSLALYNEGALTKDALSKAELAAATAAAAVTAAKAKLSDASSQYTSENSQLNVSKIESQLSETRRQLEKYTIVSPCDGTVVSKNFTEGHIVSPGFDIMDVASASERYLVAYIPVKQINNLDYGQTISVQYDGDEYQGTLKYMDVKSQYTPKDLQTAANKSRKTVKIKLLMPAECPMKPGEQATIQLP